MAKTGVQKRRSGSKSAKIKPTDFVHLHNHTHYSVLDGLTKIPELVKRVKELGMTAVAVTDHGTLSGVIEFYQTARAQDIKPIIGMETYVAPRTHLDKDPQKDKQIYHLTLLAMTNQGYQNLMRLSTIANLDGFYYKPRIDRQLLERYSEGLIVLSGCIGGEVGDALRQNQEQQAREAIEWYKSVFGDRYYLEVQDHGHQWAEQGRVNERILALAKEYDIPAVVTSDAHYVKHEDQEAHELLLCVQTGAFYADEGRMSLKDMDLFVEDPTTIADRWVSTPEVITNTKRIADRCHVEITMGQILIPKFPVTKGNSAHEVLERSTWQGLAWRYGGVEANTAHELTAASAKKHLTKALIARAEYELSTITKMGFDDYFLIVADFVNWGKDKGIVFGPGRGSAAGSIVSYALKITDIDPIAYDLLFERFLNPDRISMPDMDIDIQDNRRDEVIRYVADKYGHDRVANIVTFGKMAARNAIRDVARVLEVPYAEADRLAKLVPQPVQGRHTPLATHIKEVSELKAEYETNTTAKKVIDLAVQLEGTIRSHGVHAAGVVIAPDDIVKFTPLEMAQKGVVATQYSMWPIEDLGLLKMDFLGLSNLTIIKNALRIVRKVYGQTINISDVPLDDRKTFTLLSHGDTTGVFQLESSGMKRYLKELKPTVFDDIISMVALYRPGPMQWIDDFIDRKHGRKAIEYLHPAMKPALESTYGVIVTQEQVMQISKDMCGFTGGQADTLRKGIAKKIPEVLAKMKTEFIEGAVKTVGADRSLMEKFWNQLEDFAAYCFNKAHSACYALIAYWTAYLKANFPDAFMAALMTSGFEDTDRLAQMIGECKRMGLRVLRPDVNESFLEFAVVPNSQAIRFGLVAVKNVGVGAVEEILRAREAGGAFQTISDFVARVDTRIVNKKALESLIKAGTFDELTDRDTLLYNLDVILGLGNRLHKQRDSGQADLFGGELGVNAGSLKLELPPSTTPERERLMWERELMGVYLSSHPLDIFAPLLNEQTVALSEITLTHDGATAQIGGMLTAMREISTKNGSKMAFVGLEDQTGTTELIIFPGAYEAIRNSISVDTVVLVDGKISTKDRTGRAGEEIKVLVDTLRVVTPEEAQAYRPTGTARPRFNIAKSGKGSQPLLDKASRLFIHVKDPDDHNQLLKLKKTLNKHPGATEAILVLGEKTKSALKLPFRVDIKNGLRSELENILSKDCVAVR